MSDRGLSTDLRQRVTDAYNKSEGSYSVLADRFGIDRMTVFDWVNLERESGSVAPRPHGGGATALIDGRGKTLLARWIEDRSDWTLAELVQRLGTEGYTVSQSTVSRTLAKLGITRKKSRSTPVSRTALTLLKPVRPGRDK